MLYAFSLTHGHLSRINLDKGISGSDQPVWIDAVEPTDEEREWVRNTYHLTLPQPTHLHDIEASARFYEEDGQLHLRSDFLLGTESSSRSVAVGFVLLGGVLFSVHEKDLPVFQQLRMLNHAQSGDVENCSDVLIDLYSLDVEYSADALERVYADLGKVSHQVLANNLSNKQAASVLASIAQAEHLNSRIRRNVMDTRRAVSFLMRSRRLSAAQMAESSQVMHDIESLDGHTAFLFDKINFLMSINVGFININQNKIVRLFSVSSVALLPPVLVASIYGMNFEHMPELEWKMGYPFALLLMALSVGIPFWIFSRKGWLK